MQTVNKIKEQLQRQYPAMECLLEPAFQIILESAKQVRIPAGTRLFKESERCQNFIWLLEGTVRVFKHSKEGREITIYRVNPGEFCVLSLQCLICEDGFPAEAIAETELFGVTMGKHHFDLALDTSKEFRHYLLRFLSQRISEVVQLVSEVTFQRLDLRLACLLGQFFERSDGAPLLLTHAQLALELGTTREVISRMLKELENHKCIQLSRGEIHLMPGDSLSWRSRS